MAFDLASISNEAVARAPRIVLLGVEKIGKTSFACGDRVADGKIVEYGLNRPVIVSVRGEQGADSNWTIRTGLSVFMVGWQVERLKG